MMRRRVDGIVWEARERRRHMGNADDQQSTGLGGLHHIGKHHSRLAQMLQYLERADRIIGATVLDEMRPQRLIAHVPIAALACEMRVEARIDRMQNDAAELRKAAANIEHTRARRNLAGRESELLPDAFARPKLALDRMGIERSIEG